MNRASLFIPLGIFLVIAVFLYRGFSLDDAHKLPSALLDRPFPEFALGRLLQPEQQAGTADLRGQVTLVNVWATWCPTCRAEHDELLRITETTGLPIVGVNYKDDPAAARVWLQRYGDPYQFSVMDRDGSLGINLGVYGAPETFLVDADGIIRHKIVGAITERIWRDELAPLVSRLQAAMEDAS